MKRLIGMLGACALLLVNSLALASDAGKERAEIRKASAKVLADLYKAKPSARKVVESAAGYATFTNVNLFSGEMTTLPVFVYQEYSKLRANCPPLPRFISML